MDIKNCKLCSRLFKSLGGNICPPCMQQVDEMYIVARDYIYDHPDCDIIEVSEATGIDKNWILQFLREGRLQLKQECVGLPCERCDRPIRSGRFCKSCASELEQGLKNGMTLEEVEIVGKKTENKMFVAERLNNR